MKKMQMGQVRALFFGGLLAATAGCADNNNVVTDEIDGLDVNTADVGVVDDDQSNLADEDTGEDGLAYGDGDPAAIAENHGPGCSACATGTLEGVTVCAWSDRCDYEYDDIGTIFYSIQVDSDFDMQSDDYGCGPHPEEEVYVPNLLLTAIQKPDFTTHFTHLGYWCTGSPRLIPVPAGTYYGAYDFAAREWYGPSDTDEPFGEPFVPGSYRSRMVFGHATLLSYDNPYGGYDDGSARVILDLPLTIHDELPAATGRHSWTPMSSDGAHRGVVGHSAVWTGSEMLVFGGEDLVQNGEYYTPALIDGGGSYDPDTDQWTTLPTEGAPSARQWHAAVWTGTEMIIWGGYDGGGPLLGDGARYNPTTQTWTPMTTDGAPPDGYWYTGISVWTGSEMLVYMGYYAGGLYNPATDSWRAMSQEGAPPCYGRPTWAQGKLYAYDGECGTGFYIYDPSTDVWTSASQSEGPLFLYPNIAALGGGKILVWEASYTHLPAVIYNVATDTWSPAPSFQQPAVRLQPSITRAGGDVFVWGGISDETMQKADSGGLFTRFGRTPRGWRTVSSLDAPRAGMDHTAVWTGSEVIIWGGFNDNLGAGDYQSWKDSYQHSGARYRLRN
jgi:hypothetical protein